MRPSHVYTLEKERVITSEACILQQQTSNVELKRISTITILSGSL